MATLTEEAARSGASEPTHEGRRAVRDSLIVTVGGQLEQVLGTITAFAMRWGLDPGRLGVYTGLRPYLDNTNRSSLGVGLGAIQEIPILRASGRAEEARRIADVAYTTNSITCLFYGAALLGWAAIRAPSLSGNPHAIEWTWGLVAMVAMVPLKRYQDFLISVLRAHQEFALTTELAVLDSLLGAAATVVGLAVAGLWGLIASVSVLMVFNILYLHARNPFRFRWDWDWAIALRLMKLGLPIWANTGLYFAVLNLDRGLILWNVPDPEAAAGLYTIALMGTGWSLDLAGRIALVMYTYFQTTLGRTEDVARVAEQAIRTSEAQAPILGAGAAVAYLVGPAFLGEVVPAIVPGFGRYLPGLPALRPLLPGAVLLGLAWPARQMLIAVNRPYRLAAAMFAALALIAGIGTFSARRWGIVGVAWSMTIGYAAVYAFTSLVAFRTILGDRAWWLHQARVMADLAWYSAGAIAAAHLPLPAMNRWIDFSLRCSLLAAWVAPRLWSWGRKHRWGGLFDRARGT
ncbi:MAG: oligosaccharide flippase family protein [Isosphaeraceae bacterium]